MISDKREYCRRCDHNEPTFGMASCPYGGGFGRIGQHIYNIHVTAVTYKCQCGSMMGRFNGWPPGDQKDVDPFGRCPAR